MRHASRILAKAVLGTGLWRHNPRKRDPLCPFGLGFKFAERAARLFPVAPIEGRDRHGLDGAGVDAARIHADAVGMRARDVKGLHSARGTKQMLGGMRIE